MRKQRSIQEEWPLQALLWEYISSAPTFKPSYGLPTVSALMEDGISPPYRLEGVDHFKSSCRGKQAIDLALKDGSMAVHFVESFSKGVFTPRLNLGNKRNPNKKGSFHTMQVWYTIEYYLILLINTKRSVQYLQKNGYTHTLCHMIHGLF